MRETLNVIKKVHLLIIFSCITIFLLSVSMKILIPYTDAINELDFFINANSELSKPQNILKYIEISPFEIDSILSKVNSYEEKYLQITRDICDKHNIDFGYSANIGARIDTFPRYPMTIELLKGSLNLIEIIMNKDGNKSIAFFKMSPDKYQSQLNLFLSQQPNIVKRIDIGIGGIFRWSRNVPFYIIEIKTGNTIIGLNIPGEKIPLSYSWNMYLALSGLSRFYTLENKIFRFMFSNARWFWNEIENMTPKQARDYLINKRSNQKSYQTISVLGIDFQGRFVIYGGPIALVFISLYLFFHLGNLLSIPLSEYKNEKHYPWIGLYTHKFAKYYTYGSILFLPPLTIIFVSIVFWNHQSFSIWVQAVFLIFVIILGYSNFSYIKRIRIKNSQNN